MSEFVTFALALPVAAVVMYTLFRAAREQERSAIVSYLQNSKHTAVQLAACEVYAGKHLGKCERCGKPLDKP